MVNKFPKEVGFPKVTSRNTPFLIATFHLVYLIIPLCIVCAPILSIIRLAKGTNTKYDLKVIAASTVYYSSWIMTASFTKVGWSNRIINSNPLMQYFLSSIPISIKVTTEIKGAPSGSYLFPCHPHGGLAFNRAAVGFCMSNLWDAAFPQLPNLKVLTASAAFYVPLIREMWLASYCIEASKKVAVKALEDGGPGTAMLVYPGGEKEQLLTKRGKERVYLSGRKGFIKLALEQGLEIVPVYAFGESDLYEHSSFLLDLRQRIQKSIGAAVPLIYGQFGLLPYFPENGVRLVFGAPIGLFQGGGKWEKGAKVTDDMINVAHKLYVEKLRELFDKEKGAMGYGDRELEIL